jgi:hypothetical protein
MQAVVSDPNYFYAATQYGSPARSHLEDALEECAVGGDAQYVMGYPQPNQAFGLTFFSTITRSRHDIARCLFDDYQSHIDSRAPELGVTDIASATVVLVCRRERDDHSGLMEVSEVGIQVVTASIGLAVIESLVGGLVLFAVCVSCCRRRHHKARGLRNDAGARVHVGAKDQNGCVVVYCGRYWSQNDFGSATGYCGPRHGPQCESCARLKLPTGSS